MQAQIRVIGGDELEEFAALYSWLREDADLRGHVAAVEKPIGDTDLGSALEMVTVAVSSGGVGAALCTSLTTWLRTRRSDLRIRVSAKGRSIEVEATHVNDVLPALQEVLRGNHES